MLKKKQMGLVFLLVSILLVSAGSFAQGTKDNDTAVSSAEALTTIKQNVVVPEQDVYDDSSGEKEKIYIKMSVFDTFLQFVLTIFAVFLGACLAFLFQNIREKRNIKNKNYSALLKTQALFYQYQNIIAVIKTSFLDEFEDDSNRMSKIKPISFCKSFAELDYEGLSFILATKEPDLYLDIIIFYRKCVSTIDAIEERNDHYQKINSKGKKKTFYESTGTCDITVDPLDLVLLVSLTDIMYKTTEQALNHIEEIDKKIQDFIKKTFKKKHS